MTEKRRGRPRKNEYQTVGKVLSKVVDLTRELHELYRVLEVIVPSKHGRGRTHDILEHRGGESWEDRHGEQHQTLKRVFHGSGIQCATCGVTWSDSEFTVAEEKLYPKIRKGRIIWRLPCGHRMDWLLPTTKAYEQIQADKMLAKSGWNLDKSCEPSGVPTVRTVRAYAAGLTKEDWVLIYKLRDIDQRRKEIVELISEEKDPGLWSARKKKS